MTPRLAGDQLMPSDVGDDRGEDRLAQLLEARGISTSATPLVGAVAPPEPLQVFIVIWTRAISDGAHEVFDRGGSNVTVPVTLEHATAPGCVPVWG